MGRTLPNFLTLLRIFLIPFIMMMFYMPHHWGRWIAASLFIAACFTDFLDGYLARLWRQTSRWGQLFDPIADKLLVASTLFLVAGFGKIHHISFIPAIVILCREIMLSGMREYITGSGSTIPVSGIAKVKTGVQMFSISCLLVGTKDDWTSPILSLGECFLWVAGFLTLWSGIDYFSKHRKYF